MSRLDRYVARIVLGAFVAALAFFLFLTVVLDLLNNLPKYAARAAEREMGGLELACLLGAYYVRLLPVLFVTMTPFVTVIACMFSLTRLQSANEIVPMLFVGRSLRRVLLPMWLCGLVAGLLMMACWQWVVPHVGAALATDEAFLQQGQMEQKALVLEHFGTPEHRLYVHAFDPATATMREVRMLTSDAAQADQVLLQATSAQWDARLGDWRLQNGIAHRRLSSQPVELLHRPDLTPSVVMQTGREALDPDALSYTELLATLAARPNLTMVQMALHRHFTFPLANLLLLLLALPLALGFERGNSVWRLLAAIGLCGGYLLLDLTCQSLGGKGLLHPIVAAWVPTLVFGSLGITLLGNAKS